MSNYIDEFILNVTNDALSEVIKSKYDAVLSDYKNEFKDVNIEILKTMSACWINGYLLSLSECDIITEKEAERLYELITIYANRI